MALTQTQVSQLYVSVFGRASEGDGSAYWMANGETLASTATAMLGSPAAITYFGSSLDTDQAFIEAIYNNTLGKTITDDPDGIAHWVGRLTAGESRGQVVATLIEALVDGDYTGDADAIAAQNQFNNRVTVSNYTADTIATADVSDLSAFTGFITSVTDDEATATAAMAAVDNAAPQTFTLTTSNDTIEGGSGADTVDGIVSSLSSEKTLAATDQIDGGDGADTINVAMKSSFTGFSGDGKLANVETVNLTSDSNIGREFDATGVTGVEQYNIDATTAAVDLKDLAALDATISLSNQAKGSFNVAYATDVTKGTSDAQAFEFENVGTVKDSANNIAEAAVTTSITGVEELTLDIAGDNVADFTAAATKTMSITGDGTLKMANGPAGLKTLDAAATTGDLDIDLNNSTDATTVALGSGDDTLTVGAGDVTKNAELTGGEGADTIELSATGTVQYNMSGFETVELGNTGALTFSAANTSDLQTIQTKGMTSTATLAGLGTGDYTAQLKGANAAGTLSLDNSGITTINVTTPASTATATSPSANVVSVTMTDSASVDMTVAEKMSYQGTVTATKASSVELDVQGEVTGATISAAAATSVVISAVENDSDLTLTAAKAADLNVTAAKDIDLTGSTLTALESLTVDTNGDFDLSGVALAKIASVTAEGSGSVELNALGAVTQDDYAINVTATGLSGDETASSASLEIASIATKGQNITVDAGGVLGLVQVGAIDASGGGVANSTAGNVTVDLDGVGDDFSLSTIVGTNVTINAAGALGTATYGNITLDQAGTLNFTGVNLDTNIVTGIATGTKDVSMTFVGGIDNDVFTVSSLAGFTGDLTIDATGDIEATGGADTLVLNGATTDLDIDSLTMSNIEALEIVTGNTVTAKAADLNGETLTMNTTQTGTLTLTGTTSAETIDLSGITDGGSAVIEVKGSTGVDTITASGGTDIFSYTADSQFGDTINSFKSGTDQVKFDIGGAATTAGAGTKYNSSGGVLTSAQSFPGTGTGIKLFVASNNGTGAIKTFTLSTVSSSTGLTAKHLLTGFTGASATAFTSALNAIGNGFGTGTQPYVVFATTTGGKLLGAIINDTTTAGVTTGEVASILTIGTYDTTVAATDIILV